MSAQYPIRNHNKSNGGHFNNLQILTSKKYEENPGILFMGGPHFCSVPFVSMTPGAPQFTGIHSPLVPKLGHFLANV